mgnify:FL=1
MPILSEQEKFLFSEFFNNSWQAIVGHNKTYIHDINKNQKDEFKRVIKMFIIDHILSDYLKGKID